MLDVLAPPARLAVVRAGCGHRTLIEREDLLWTDLRRWHRSCYRA